MTYHLEKEIEIEFVASLRTALEVIHRMIEKTGGRRTWGNGTNTYLTDVVEERIRTAYLEALTYLGLTDEHERLEQLERDSLFLQPLAHEDLLEVDEANPRA